MLEEFTLFICCFVCLLLLSPISKMLIELHFLLNNFTMHMLS